MRPEDFSSRTTFPGTEGGPFEVMVRFAEHVNRAPALLYGLLLLVLAALSTGFDTTKSVLLTGFFMVDWLLVAGLARAGRSFGPAKPQSALLAALRAPFGWLSLPWFLGFQLLGTILVVYGFWVEPLRLTISREELITDKLPPKLTLTLLHFGDLHMERITKRERKLVEEILSLSPDVIMFSGDFLSFSNVRDEAAWDQVMQMFSSIRAPLGTYAVLGSPPVDIPDVVVEMLEGTKVSLLIDERVSIQKDGEAIYVFGVSCTHRPFLDGPKLKALMESEEGRFRILLYHSPDLAPLAAEMGIDLQLSGHTHGGQVRLPLFGALYTSSLYGKRLESGRKEIGNLTLYVTRGIGLEGKGAPRVRFLSPPEIVLWTIKGCKG